MDFLPQSQCTVLYLQSAFLKENAKPLDGKTFKNLHGHSIKILLHFTQLMMSFLTLTAT